MGVATMSKNLFAWASIGENGKGTGGKKGDQTGKEVRVGAYYNFGQDKVIRFKNVLKGRKMAKVAKLLASDDSCGYSMTLGERETLFRACKGYNWDFEKVKKLIMHIKEMTGISDALTYIQRLYDIERTHWG